MLVLERLGDVEDLKIANVDLCDLIDHNGTKYITFSAKVSGEFVDESYYLQAFIRNIEISGSSVILTKNSTITVYYMNNKGNLESPIDNAALEINEALILSFN
ncbi:MAG: hypothetical protein ABIA04_01990 [Pseudomonadota bacterium]